MSYVAFPRPEHFLRSVSMTRIPFIIKIFFIADMALIFSYVANQALGTPFYALTYWLDLDGEASFPTWYSVIQLACVAALAGLFAVRNTHLTRVSTWPLLLLPLVFIALSIDELVQIHEWVGYKIDALLLENGRENTIFQNTGIWIFVFGIPFVVGVLGILFILRRWLNTVPGVLPKIILGLVVLATGALLIETLSNFTEKGSVWHHLEVVCEEGCEMLGVTIILWAFYDLLKGHGLQIHLNPVDAHWP